MTEVFEGFGVGVCVVFEWSCRVLYLVVVVLWV